MSGFCPESEALARLAAEPGRYRQAAKRLCADIRALGYRNYKDGVLAFIKRNPDDDPDTAAFIHHLKQRIILERLVK